MKRKNYIFSLALALLMGTMTMSLTACSSEDIVANNTQQPAQGEVRTYTVSIPATFSGDEAQTRAVTFDNSGTPPTATGSFETTENIYVYNETKGTLLSGTLHPSDISADKKHCQLAGTLTGTIDASDKLTLVYNMNSFNTGYPNACSFTYVSQEGSEAGIIDGGMATGVSATISSGTLTTADPVKFKMQQAIFRLKFTDGTNPITVKSLLIKPTTGSYIAYYSPFKEDNRYSGDRIGVSPASATSDYLYVDVCINESGAPSELTFTVTDNAGKVYSATKAAPTGGFKNGKYYYSSDAIPLTFQMQLVAPTVTWTSVKDGSVEPDMNNMYTVNGPWVESISNYGPAEIAISGTSTGYRFSMAQESTIKLNGLTATYKSNPFITTSSPLTLDISGANSITCKSSTWAISVSGSVLRLSGSGTLTVTVDNADNYGLYAVNYYEPYHFSDVSTLAAPGYTVTRSDRTDNGDGTYTWTYTVAPDLATPLTLEATANGDIKVYPTVTMSYSVDGGTPVAISANTTISVTAGQKVSFYSTNSALAKVEGGISNSTYIIPKIPCYVYGNVMSLIDDSGTGFANDKTISADNALKNLFHEPSGTCPNLINHPTKRILLPATTLANNCYDQMFYGCTGLTVAPDLPATELKSLCYYYMFHGCTSLTTAPDLPAPTLAERCYMCMFEGCTSLNYVKCLATNVSAMLCLYKWLKDVSATETFVKASGASWSVADTNGSNGYPSGWTVQTE